MYKTRVLSLHTDGRYHLEMVAVHAQYRLNENLVFENLQLVCYHLCLQSYKQSLSSLL